MMDTLAAGFPLYFEQNIFQSHWQLTQICNFNCSYCVNRHLRHEGISMSKDLMLHALRTIAGVKCSRFHFCLSGGEVTLYPHLVSMLENIGLLFPIGSTVTLMSNGSASVDRMRNLISIDSGLNVRFVITVHLGQTRPAALMAKLLQFSHEERKAHFNVKIVTPPGDSEGLEIANTFAASGIDNCALLPVLDFNTGHMLQGYNREELDRFHPRGKKSWFNFRHITGKGQSDVTFVEGLEKNLFHYKGMYCAAGRQSIFLDEHGHVSRGQFCGRMPYTILEQNPFEDEEFMKPAICREEHCTCIPFTALPKWRNADYAPASCRNISHETLEA